MANVVVERGRQVLRLTPRLAFWGATLTGLAWVLVGPMWVGVALLSAVTTFSWSHCRRPGHFTDAAVRIIVVSTLLAAGTRNGTVDLLLLLGALALLATLLLEPVADRELLPGLSAVNLPGVAPQLADRVPAPLLQAGCLGILGLAAATLGLLPTWIATAVVVLGLVAGWLATVAQLLEVRRRSTERAIAAALSQFDPRYFLYYAGPLQGAYQVQMWLAPLAATGERGAIVVRDPRFLPVAAALSDLPVILARRVEPLEFLTGSGVRAVFYVNNDPRNVDGVRFSELQHVALGHGDSEKPASYAAAFGMYSKVFVAGQAAIDRFAAHGVLVHREKFVLVGRPQLARVIERRRGELPKRPCVLYAPTWRGGLSDMVLGSLVHGEQIVAALLATGANVLFRPHPLSHRDTESRVLIRKIDALLAVDPANLTSGQTGTLTVFECMNRSDAMLADISSVVSDYLYADKPFIIATSEANRALVASTPLLAAGVLLQLGDDPTSAIAELLGPDTRRTARQQVRAHYLGGWSEDEYAGQFTAAARAAMSTSQPA